MRCVTFLSDYGTDDDFVGVCHAVIAGIAPEARVIDLTHGIGRHDIRQGALTLARALPFAPAGVHLAVVDPMVGAQRRAVALRCADEDRILVGPDNGLLMPAAAAFGGAVEAVDVARSPHRLEPVSATFHGRDLFAPVAAHLAAGAPLAGAGDPLPVEELTALALPSARVADGRVEAHALAFDGFGNVQLDVTHDQLAGSGLKLGRAVVVNGVPGPVRPDVRRRRRRRAGPLRGRLPLARAGRQPRLGRGAPRARARRRRGPGAGVTLGTPRLHLRRTDSTSERAKALAAGAPHGLLVTAAEQTAGHGRQGRTWSAPPGEGLLMSLVLRRWDPLLPLAAGVAVAEAAGPDARIKWPNDILVADRKVAGILVEARAHEGWAVLGIGVNVAVREFPAELRESAGSLGRSPADVEPFLRDLLASLDRRLRDPAEAVLAAWRERDALRGRVISWGGGTGTADGVDEAGRLLVTLPGGGTTALDAGEVHLGPLAPRAP